ncbi:MAG: hypothetical protein ACD_12C00500G0001 [uncultured bacterium]|nr:MAG: hypothetical protein ACD_12C00500G0001 [uncultured bacterium]
MKVVLIKDHPSVGKKGDVKEVAAGYARNFLFPRKVAVLASSQEIKRLDHERENEERKTKEKEEELTELKNKLSKTRIIIKVKVNDDLKLFGSLSKKDISEELSRVTGEKIGSEMVVLKEPIKRLGEYKVPIKILENSSENILIKLIEGNKNEKN